MVVSALKYSIFLTIITISIFILFGFIYNYIENRNTRNILSLFGYKGILFTGIVGTTIHELSHLLMCLIFNHKITDFQLFNLKGYKNSGVLGYVSHKYNNNSLYQKCGNFFIGVSPMIFGTFFIIFSFKLLLPNIFNSLDIENYIYNISNIELINILSLILHFCKLIFLSLFKIENFYNINFYIFIYIMFSISTHMSLSKEDLKSSLIGIFSLFSIFFIISILCVIFEYNVNSLLISFIKFIIYLSIFLGIGIFFAMLSLIISTIAYKIKKSF